MAGSVRELMQQAVTHHGRGELEAASRLYSDVLRREPEHDDALHLMGVVAHQQGRNDDAVTLINRAIARRPRAPAYRNNLGMVLTALGRMKEAEDAYRKALEIAPDFVDALLNFGNLRAGQGQLKEAVSLLERAVALDASVPQAHYSLGCARLALGDLGGALDALERALASGADFAEVRHQIGSLQLSLDRLPQAVASFTQVIARDPGHLGAQHGLLNCLNRLPAGVDSEQLEAAVAPLLRATSINPRTFGHAAARLLESKYLQEKAGESEESHNQLCELLLEDEVARLYLQRTINVSPAIERLLTGCRSNWLASAREGSSLPPSRWKAVGAVAVQCFLNEFVWAVTAEEERGADVIEQRIIKSCSTTGLADDQLLSDLLIYACFRPLWRIRCAAQLRAKQINAWPPALRELIRVCIHEPLRERELQSDIASSSEVRDAVSKAVQAQYEESPYPRWLTITRREVQEIDQLVRRWCPGYVAPAVLQGPLRVLVAGCGTGLEAIDVALHLKNARVTAVDLSRASLAYAMRKAEEYGLENIRFQQQDILEIGGFGESFHVIYCTGVLHHMQDPAAGLRSLVKLLVSNGLIKLALYSQVARVPLVEAREVIRASGFGSGEADIRAFRRQVLEDGAQGALGEIMGSTDFFSLSECRDLLFHAHEVQLTLPEVRSLLEETGLGFLGFELPISEVEQGFQREHPDAQPADLNAWAEYEQRHPESFRSMYHFWCRAFSA